MMIIYSVRKKTKKIKKYSNKPRKKSSIKKNWQFIGKTVNSLFVGLKYVVCFSLILGTLGVAASGTYKVYKSNDILILKDVIFKGNQHTSRSEILNLLQLEFGIKLLEIQNSDLEELLESHPWIQEAKVSKTLPSKLKITIIEKQPVALCYMPESRKSSKKSIGMFPKSRGKSNWYGISPSGEFLPDISLNEFNLPIIEMYTVKDSSSLSNMLEFLSTAQMDFQGIYNTISQIKFENNLSYTVLTRDNSLKFLVSTDEENKQTLKMWNLLMMQKGDKLGNSKTIDLRVKGYAYVS